MSGKLSRLEMFSQEIGTSCNLTARHERCPSHALDRYASVDTTKLMSDDMIIYNVDIAYRNGFEGKLAWHFYNEPTLEIDRLETLEKRIKRVNRNAELCLWTNGILIGEGRPIPWQRLDFFSEVVITNYEKRDWKWLKALRPGVHIYNGRLDHRLEPMPGNRDGCGRIRKELIIDAYGNWRLCCGDFRTSRGMNVHTDGFQAIIDTYDQIRRLIVQTPQPDGVPEICDSCRMRH